MAQPQPHFFDALEKYDPEFYKAATAFRNASRGPSLDNKTRVLITMALDATNGAAHGVKNLSRQARALGATENEIKEVLRLVASNKMNEALATSMHAFEE